MSILVLIVFGLTIFIYAVSLLVRTAYRFATHKEVGTEFRSWQYHRQILISALFASLGVMALSYVLYGLVASARH